MDLVISTNVFPKQRETVSEESFLLIKVVKGANQTVQTAKLKEDVNKNLDGKEKGMITICNPASYSNDVKEMLNYIDYLLVNQTEAELMTAFILKRKLIV
ncbi:MAG: hypothetical protein ACOX56_06440 [Acholeplasmataceae bacterium]